MEKIVCHKHKLELSIPTTDKEFQLDVMHENIIQLCSHHKQFPSCKFFKTREES